ncbi:MAG: AI-2E family transporter [Desulfobacterales bacterium]
MVHVLGRIRISPLFSSAIIVASIFLMIFSALIWLSEPAGEWLDRAPKLIREVEFKFYNIRKKVQEAQKTTEKLEAMTEVGTDYQEKVVVEGPSLAEQLIGHGRSFSVTAFMVTVLLYLFLAKGGAFLNQVTHAIGNNKVNMQLMNEIRHEITGYLLVISFINLCLGIITAGVMALLDMPNPFLWGVMAGFLNFVPYIGGAVTTGVLVIVSFVTFENWTRILLPPMLYILINATEGFIVTPMVLGNRFSINPIVIILSLLFWGWIWGVVGMFLAMPILVFGFAFVNKINMTKSKTAH